MLYILIFFYSWVFQLDIYLVTVIFMFNVQMFNVEKKYSLKITQKMRQGRLVLDLFLFFKKT